MKIAGIDLNKTTNIIIPIIRGEDEIIFQAQIIENYDEFEKLCPEPVPPMKQFRGQEPKPFLTDPEYLEAVQEHSSKRVAYMFIKSLEPTEGLKWDKVNLSDPETWSLYEEELRAAKFSEMQIVQLLNGIMEANGLSQDRIEDAKKRFLDTQLEDLSKQSSPEDAQ